jgi:hypothetical protein
MNSDNKDSCRELFKKKLAITIILTVTKKNWRANVYVYVSV